MWTVLSETINILRNMKKEKKITFSGCPRKFYRNIMYIAPSSGHAALFKWLMKIIIHSNPPKQHSGLISPLHDLTSQCAKRATRKSFIAKRVKRHFWHCKVRAPSYNTKYCLSIDTLLIIHKHIYFEAMVKSIIDFLIIFFNILLSIFFIFKQL